MSRRHTHQIFSVAALLLLVAAAIAFAPLQIGGRTAFVIVSGNSMEPVYHEGDLVIARAASDYEVGDIVTYRHPTIGPVIHEIIGRSGDRWVFQGVNNDFIDPYQPTQDELIGRSWLHVPSAGRMLAQLRTPQAILILALLLGALVLSGLAATGRSPALRRDRRRASDVSTASTGGLGTPITLGVLALASLALTLFAWTRPVTRDATDDVTYEQRGAFSYSAEAPSGLYDEPTVRTGEPIFSKLTRTLAIEFAYTVATEHPSELSGTHRLVAEISSNNGWRRTFTLQPEQGFSGASFTTRGIVDLDALRRMVESFERRTQVDHKEYRFAIVPQVTLAGSVAGQGLRDSFSPRLEFRLDDLQLQLVAGDDDLTALLSPSRAGLLKISTSEPETLAFLGLRAEVAAVRWLGLAALALSLTGLIATAAPLLRAARSDAAARIWITYGAMIVEAAPGSLPTSTRTVALATINDLARLAERHGLLMLHDSSEGVHRYVVLDGEIGYSYQAGPTELETFPGYPAGDEGDEAAEGGTQWQAVFLARLCETGLTSEACRAAGIGIVEAYRERERVPAFAQAWRAAQANGGYKKARQG
jgi:signal peptidase I